MIREGSLLPPFIPLEPTAKWARGLLIVNVAVAAIAVGIDLSELRLLFRASGGTAVEPIERAAQFLSNEWLLAIQSTLLVATAVAFLLWLYQARVNIRALGVRRPKYGRQWTVLSFLIPIANLFQPYQVVREIWQASDPANLDPIHWKNVRPSRLLILWWAFFVGYIGLETLSWLSGFGAGMSLAKLQLSTALVALSDLCAALAAGAAYFVVASLGEMQDEKYALLLELEEEEEEKPE